MYDVSFHNLSAKRLLANLTNYIFDDPYIAVRIIVVICGITVAVIQKLVWNVSVFYYINVLQEHPYFGAAFGIFSLGAAMTVLQQAWSVFRRCYNKYMTSSLQVPLNDQYFNMLVQWLYTLELDSPYHVAVVSRQAQNRYDDYGNLIDPNKKAQPPYDFLPHTGIRQFEFQGELVYISVASDDPGNRPGLEQFTGGLTLTIRQRNTTLFRDILEQAYLHSQAQNSLGIQVFTAQHGSWNNRNPNQQRKKRPMDSVVLEKGVADRLIKDMDEFRQHAKWYADRAIPYRRGYLLYGPPGTGKTSFITALAGHYNMSVGILNLSESWLSDDTFNEMLNNAPADCILLLEDVDSAFINRAEDDADSFSTGPSRGKGKPRKGKGENWDKQNSTVIQKPNTLTFSGFLNALDGVSSGEGRILIMTTNYIDRLDSALIRPGRVDFQQEIGYASEYQLEMIYRRFYPDQSEDQAKEFAGKAFAVNKEVTLAQVQGLFIRHKFDPENLHQDLNLLQKQNAGPRRHYI